MSSSLTPVPPISIDDLSKTPEPMPPISDLGLPSVDSFTCANIDATVAMVKNKFMSARPTSDGQAQLQAWYDTAQQFKDKCSASGSVATTASSISTKISKNMRPIAVALGITLGVVLLFKIFKD